MNHPLLDREFVACMFDYDGTLIERGYRMPLPEYMPELLQETSRKTYTAICTARPFPAIFKHAHQILGDHFDELKRHWVWICEGGGVGYTYDEEAQDFKEFYRVPWPEDVIPLTRFSELVRSTFDGHVSEIDVHESVIILRPHHLSTLSVSEIISSCDVLQRMGVDLIEELGLQAKIRLGNSALGVIFCSADADKDRGIYEFGKYLESKGLAVTEPFRNIICFGDRPGKYGNDEHFLNGRYGTPVNVGDEKDDHALLYVVHDDTATRLIGPRATAHLLRQLHFKNL